MSASAMQGGHKELKPGLVVASFDIWPGNGEGLFWFWCFINLSFTYLLRHLRTYLQPRDPYRAGRYRDGVCNTTEENSTVFSIIQM